MTLHADFGKLVIETDVDQAVLGALRLWMPDYINHLEIERGIKPGLLARPVPASYGTVLEDDGFPNNRMPQVLVTTSALDQTEMRQRDYGAGWRCAVTTINRGRSKLEAREYASLYGGCVRRILVQQDLGDLDAVAVLENGNIGSLADTTAENRMLAACTSIFTVYTDDLVSKDGPALNPTPYDPPDPENPGESYEPLAQVGSVDVAVRGVPMTTKPGG